MEDSGISIFPNNTSSKKCLEAHNSMTRCSLEEKLENLKN
jgi:hypothetical protein